MKLLRSASKLKNTKIQAHKKIGIGRDLTKKQRERNDELRSQFAKIKKDFTNRNWAIRREKVVEVPGKGIPPLAPGYQT